jgi:hypothetical protein
MWTAKIYAAILNGRLLRRRIDFDHVETRDGGAARAAPPSSILSLLLS